ncbi:N4-gp56 family major capsid protein [Eubacteriales bacterium OttesenSCG-928-N14]|nr:N4-gp56 family major capsid protein [Eubacteriales bacterium OttesenSCG-928-N14]
MALNANLTSTTGLSSTMQTYYDKKLLLNAKPNLVHQMYGQKVVLPKNSGKSVQFRKWTPFEAVTTALSEGVVPDGQSLAMTNVTADINQYGGYVAVSDLLDMTALDPVINDSVELMGDQGGLSLDTLVKNVIVNSTNVQYAGGKTSRSALTETCILTVDEVRKAVRTLKKNKAPQFVRNGKGYYVAIVGPETTYDLQSDALWQDVSKYNAAEQIFDGEIGKMFGVVFVETSEAQLFSGSDGVNGRPVAATMVFGKNAYGVVDIEGGNLRSIIKPKGSAGTADPLDQISTIGWKVGGFCAKVLQPLWMVRIEHMVSQ